MTTLNPTPQLIDANAPSSSVETARPRKDTFDFASDFISILHAGEQNPLGGWDKQVRLGSIKRRTEDNLGQGQHSFHVIEIAGNNSSSTFIVSPKVPFAELNIELPNLILVCKNTGRSFQFEVQVEDEKGLKHRFHFSNSNLQVPRRTHFLTFIPLRFQDGWNDVCIDLAHLTEKVYGLKFAKVVRVKICANIRLQQVFFVNDAIWTGQCPVPALKMMNNVKMIATGQLPMVNPHWRETGPEQRQIPHAPDPLDISKVARVEAELAQRGARLLDLPPTPSISFYKKSDFSSRSFVSKSKINTNSRSRSKSPVGGQLSTSNSFRNQLHKINLPEAEEAMKLMNVVRHMNVNPKDDPTVYVTALKQMRQAEARARHDLIKPMHNVSASNSSPLNHVEKSGFKMPPSSAKTPSRVVNGNNDSIGGNASKVNPNNFSKSSAKKFASISKNNDIAVLNGPSTNSNHGTTNSIDPALQILANDLTAPLKNFDPAAIIFASISQAARSLSTRTGKEKNSVGTSTDNELTEANDLDNK